VRNPLSRKEWSLKWSSTRANVLELLKIAPQPCDFPSLSSPNCLQLSLKRSAISSGRSLKNSYFLSNWEGEKLWTIKYLPRQFKFILFLNIASCCLRDIKTISICALFYKVFKWRSFDLGVFENKKSEEGVQGSGKHCRWNAMRLAIESGGWRVSVSKYQWALYSSASFKWMEENTKEAPGVAALSIPKFSVKRSDSW